jgi:cellulose synthase/poly-beta-1,6-N-acetylglucosamine synthase-like glycosyltransferase/Leucine-rich repeat (LRR) protein
VNATDSVALLNFEDDAQIGGLATGEFARVEAVAETPIEGQRAAKITFSAVPGRGRTFPAVVISGEALAVRDFRAFEAISLWVKNPGPADTQLSLAIWDQSGSRGFPVPSTFVIRPGEWRQIVGRLVLSGLDAERIGSVHFYQKSNRQSHTLLVDNVQLLSPYDQTLASKLQLARDNLNRARESARALGAHEQLEPTIAALEARLETFSERSQAAQLANSKTLRLQELANMTTESQQLADAIAIEGNGASLILRGPHVRAAWLRDRDKIQLITTLVLENTPLADDAFALLTPAQGLQTLVVEGQQFTGAGLASLSPDKVQRLFIGHTAAHDDALASLPRFLELRDLHLQETRVTSRFLQFIEGLHKLKSLNLNGTGVSDADFAAIAKLTSLESLELDRTRITGQGLRHLQGLRGLKSLNLRNTAIDDAGLAHLGRLVDLRSLLVANTHLTGAEFAQLEPLDKLVVLDLNGTRVGDSALRRLGKLPELRRLELSSTPITDASLAHISQSARLEYVNLYGTSITDAGLAHLASQKGLQNLYLAGTRVSSKGLGYLRELKDLRNLDLEGTQVTDAGLMHLAALTNLVTLKLGNTKINGEGLAHLAGLSELVVLDLSGTEVDGAALASLAHLEKLRRLNLSGTRVSSEGLRGLEATQQILDLDLEATDVGDEGLDLLTALANLERLNLSETAVTDLGLKHLQRMEKLTTLSLNHTKITDAGLAYLGDGYTTLELAHTGVTDRGLERLQRNGRLESLRLSSTAITDGGLRLLEALPNLRLLDLARTTVSDSGPQHLLALPALEELDLSGTRVTDVGARVLLKLSNLRRLSLENTRVTSQGASFLKRQSSDLEVQQVFPWVAGERWTFYALPTAQEKDEADARAQGVLPQLKSLTSLGYLHLYDSLLGPSILRALKDLSTLEHLSFRGASLTDEHLPHMLGLSRLARLDLSQTSITDAGLIHLQDMQGLRELDLRGTRVTGQGLAHLAALLRLQELHLPISVDDDGLAGIGRLKSLTALTLSNSKVTDEGLAHLLPLSNLQYLDLYGTALSDAGVADLCRLTSLRYLYLTNTRLTDDGIAGLHKLTQLEELGLDGTSLTDRGLAIVRSFPHLRRLRIGRTQVTDAGLAHTSALPNITTLELQGLPITDDGLKELRSLSKLRSLDLSGTRVTDGGLASLGELPALEELVVWDTRMTSQGVARFREQHPAVTVNFGVTPSPYGIASLCLTAVYVLAVVAICFYGIHRYWLAWLFVRDNRVRAVRDPPDRFAVLPVVTVQLPLFNERHVAQRIISAAAALDYPRDRLQIQVLDDSTDETVDIARGACHRLAAAGCDIQYLHRQERAGFKGGALEAALPAARGEFIAVFDADFVPPAGILQQMIHHFTAPQVGLVQAQWSHLNRNQSLLTECQAMFLDGHFVVEQAARSATGRWFNFNGTAGIWRKTCIADAGGWQHDTLTEDTDLSYRAQLQGWKFIFLPAVRCGAELPRTMTAFLWQQHRWTKGVIQTAKKLLPRILRSGVPWQVKLEAWFHLTSPLMYVIMFLVTVIALPSLFLATPFAHWQAAALAIGIVTLGMGTCAAATFYIVSQRAQGISLARTLLRLPVLMALGIGMCAVNARAVVEALLGLQSPFVRTPKFGGRADCELDPAVSSRPWGIASGLLELAIAGVLAACLVLGFFRPFSLIGAPFLLLFAAGYLGVGIASLRDHWGSALAEQHAVPRPVRRLLAKYAVATLAVVMLASASGATLLATRQAEGEAPQEIGVALDLTTADWRITGDARQAGGVAGAIKEIYVDGNSLLLNVDLDRATDEGEIALDLEGPLAPLGNVLAASGTLAYDVEYPSRFTGEVQAYVRDKSNKSEYGSMEVVEGGDIRRAVNVVLHPTLRVPPMGYQDDGFDPARGIRQIGLKISAQSDRVRGAGYRPFRGKIRLARARVVPSDPIDDSEPEIIAPLPGKLRPLPEVSLAAFRAVSGVDRPWPLGYAFSGPINDSHIAELEATYAAIARHGCTFTRVYIGDYRTGLLYDGQGKVASVEPDFVEFVDRLAEVANRHGVTVMFSLTDNTMIDGRGVEKPEFIKDGADSQSFINNVLAVLIKRLAGRQVVWDIFNEPENATAISLRDIQRYVDRVLVAGRRADPNARFTVVSRSRSDLVYWHGRGLDLHSHNIFTPQSLASALDAPRHLDAPIMVAEMAPELATETNLTALRQAGYSAVGVWGWDTGDKYDWQADDLPLVVERFQNTEP